MWKISLTFICIASTMNLMKPEHSTSKTKHTHTPVHTLFLGIFKLRYLSYFNVKYFKIMDFWLPYSTGSCQQTEHGRCMCGLFPIHVDLNHYQKKEMVGFTYKVQCLLDIANHCDIIIPQGPSLLASFYEVSICMTFGYVS